MKKKDYKRLAIKCIAKAGGQNEAARCINEIMKVRFNLKKPALMMNGQKLRNILTKEQLKLDWHVVEAMVHYADL